MLNNISDILATVVMAAAVTFVLSMMLHAFVNEPQSFEHGCFTDACMEEYVAEGETF